MFYQFFFSSQIKRIVITSNRRGMYELSHELWNNPKDPKSCHNYSLVPSLPPKFCQHKQKTFQKLKLKFFRSALFHTNLKMCVIYFGQDCSIQFFEILNILSIVNGVVVSCKL